MAQVLELGIVNALIILDLIPDKRGKMTDPVWDLEVDAFSERNFKKTMGGLKTELAKVTSVPPGLEQHLEKALKSRNFITHRFFRERALDFHTGSGRDRMIAELIDARD